MRIQVLTSCTGRKKFDSDERLVHEDFLNCNDHIHNRENSLKDLCLPAREMYTGQQHVRLMRGIEAVRAMKPSSIEVELSIFSAGYGLLDENRCIAPYECTFNNLSPSQSLELMHRTGSLERFETILRQKYDFTLILLGNSYLKLLNISSLLQVNSPTLFIAGKNVAARLRHVESVQTLSLTNQDAKRISCGMVGLKGEVANRILCGIAADAHTITRLMEHPRRTLDELVDH